MASLSVNQINGIKSGLRFATAGLLGFLFYQAFDLMFGYWTVVTIAAVMHPNLDATAKKCLLRLIGTLLGVLFGYISILIINIFPSYLYILFFANMFLAGLLIFADKKNSYFGVIFGVTYIIIITTYDIAPDEIHGVIFDRTIDVIVGILIGWVCTQWLLPIQHVDDKRKLALEINLRIPRIEYALTVALATTLSLIPWFTFHYSGGYWAPFACLIIIEETLDQTQKKSFERFIAHVVVLAITALVSVFLNSTLGLAFALMFGLFIFGYLMENPFFGFPANIANTMAIAFVVILLSAPGEANTWSTVFARFANTILGIAVGMIVVAAVSRSKRYNS